MGGGREGEMFGLQKVLDIISMDPIEIISMDSKREEGTRRRITHQGFVLGKLAVHYNGAGCRALQDINGRASHRKVISVLFVSKAKEETRALAGKMAHVHFQSH